MGPARLMASPEAVPIRSEQACEGKREWARHTIASAWYLLEETKDKMRKEPPKTGGELVWGVEKTRANTAPV